MTSTKVLFQMRVTLTVTGLGRGVHRAAPPDPVLVRLPLLCPLSRQRAGLLALLEGEVVEALGRDLPALSPEPLLVDGRLALAFLRTGCGPGCLLLAFLTSFTLGDCLLKPGSWTNTE